MSQLKPPINPSDHAQGDPRAPIQLVEYGDYECPFCARADGVVKALQQALGDNLLYVFRNFPVTQVHPHAMRAAQAAEAAGLQDRFWEMHDVLFANQDALEDDDLFAYAQELGLDMERFAADIESDDVVQKVRADFLSGARSGVNGTPTFFVNGERYDGSWEAEPFLAYLLALLESARVSPSP
jgi:protein-disulfide isomerase